MPIRKTDACPRCAVAPGSAPWFEFHYLGYASAGYRFYPARWVAESFGCSGFISFLGSGSLGASNSPLNNFLGSLRVSVSMINSKMDHIVSCRTFQISHSEENADPKDGRLPALGCSGWFGSEFWRSIIIVKAITGNRLSTAARTRL
jgi:hypothetical protein